MPTGRIVLQPPPEITPAEGLSNLLMQAVPMLGSVGSMGFVALASPGPRGYVGAGMFLEKRREDRLRDLGWEVVRYTWDDALRRPDVLALRVRRAFERSASRRAPASPAS